ncbi:MAG: hypothetical protein RLZZ241_650 [Bacteroidota bacterium]|jgi:molybdopterin-guanine dinucleotide biosynthesis protein A
MNQEAEVWGLVLAGGKSIRMGYDKGLLHYHGKPQRLHIYEELKELLPNTFMSLRPEQENYVPDKKFHIYDQNQFKGPFNGLLSAHHKFPDVAWLVVACDLPLLSQQGLNYLLNNRNKDAIATALTRTDSNLPEPLIAIWEPQGLKQAKAYLQIAESSCPRKFLLNNHCHMLTTQSNDWLENANAPEDYKSIVYKIKSR